MASKVPYLATPGSIATALERIKSAATPPIVNPDFVVTKLKVKGGPGHQVTPFLKKIGFVAGDGTPTNLYERFRNSNPSVSGAAVAEAIRHGYAALYEVNEYAHELDDKALKGLIVQVTGLAENNSVVGLALSTFKKLEAYADFESEARGDEAIAQADGGQVVQRRRPEVDYRIGYTINLNLPPTTNVEVFNAIFKSLKENLLND
jgi:hypothetical protein